MSLEILSIGLAVPQHVIGQDHAAEYAVTTVGQQHGQWLVPALYRRSGVGTRHCVVLESVVGRPKVEQSFYQPALSEGDRGPSTAARMELYERSASDLAVIACRRALDQSEMQPQDITHVITVTCTGFHSPGVDINLMRQLGLPVTTARLQVGFMGCHGALNALRAARAIGESDPNARILLCAVELCSLHHQYGWDPEQIVANALFADGAAAVVVRGGSPDTQYDGCWSCRSNASMLLPDTEDLMSWRIGDHGFQMTLSAKVPDILRSQLRPWLEQWLQAEGLGLDEVRSWAIHPGGPRILQACEESLQLESNQLHCSRQVLVEYGNMSSPTLLFVLDRLQQTGAKPPLVLLGFGPGLVAEAALLR